MNSGHGSNGEVIAFQNDKESPERFFGLYHDGRGLTRYVRAESIEYVRKYVLAPGEVVLPTRFVLISEDNVKEFN